MRLNNIIITLISLALCLNASADTKDDVAFIYEKTGELWTSRLSWMSPNEYRHAIKLNGDWEYRTNNDNPWKPVIIPATYEYEGDVSFRKIFAVDSTLENKKFKLVCYGINYYCTVFINKKFVGSHAGGSSFAIDLPQNVINSGLSNVIEINVQSTLDTRNSVPIRNQILGAKHFGGIFRDIYLMVYPDITADITSVKYSLVDGLKKATVQATVEVRNNLSGIRTGAVTQTHNLKCVLELREPGTNRLQVRKTFPIAEDLKVTTQIESRLEIKNPKLWSPEQPFVYQFVYYLQNGRTKVDSASVLTGIKDVKVINNDLFLNGKRLVLSGVNYYEYFQEYGDSVSEKLWENDVERLKNLGANAVRVVGFPPHPLFVELCDRSGLFVFEENPLYWIPPTILQSEQYFTRMTDIFSEIINRDKMHPSVFAWGIGGPFTGVSAEVLNKVIATIRSLDERPFYQINSIYIENRDTDANISILDLYNLDKVLVMNRLGSWIPSTHDKISMIFMGSSLESGSKYQKSETVHQEIQVNKIVETWKILKKYNTIDGIFINTLRDWQTNYPLMIYGPRENADIYPSGLITIDNDVRLVHHAVRSLFIGSKPRLNPGLTLEQPKPDIFPLIGVIVLLIFLFIYNTRRYVQENFKRIFVHPHGFFVDIRDKRKVPFSHTLLLTILSSLGMALVAATMGYYYRENMFFDHLLTLLSTNPETKLNVISLFWDPGVSISIFSALFVGWFLLVGIFIKICAVVFRKNIPFGQSLTLSVWTGANFILLLPIGMVLYRILVFETLFYIMMGILLFIGIWYIGRIIKAIKVVYYWTSVRSAIFVLTVTASIGLIMYYYYQRSYAIFDYLELYANHLIKF